MSANPYDKLSELIDLFSLEKNKMTLEELQDLRENISLTLFYLSDSAATIIAAHEAYDYERRRAYAEREEYYRNSINPSTGKNYIVADSERLTRMEMKSIDNKVATALREKEKIKIVLTAVKQILNSLSGRINQLIK